MNAAVEREAELRLAEILRRSEWRMECLRAVRSLALPDCWIGAGLVRNAVWDEAHGWPLVRHEDSDVDVVFFDPSRIDFAVEAEAERELQRMAPGHAWSVKNQARMHLRNGDPPYASSVDAIRRWPETATAVAVRLRADGDLEVAAPHGLGDLFSLVLRPTAPDKLGVFRDRVRAKGWSRRWPGLRVVEG